VEVRGNLAEMNRRLGTAILTNRIKVKTRKLEPRRRNQCVGINGTLPHTPADDEKPLRFSHNPWRSRLAILEDCLAEYEEGGGPNTPDTLYYIPDLDRFEQEFIEAHLPWDHSGKILCRRCDRAWTAAWQAERRAATSHNGQSAPSAQPTTPAVSYPTTTEQLTVELIFGGLTNTQVLSGIRKVFPGRATMNTVAYYRTHQIHDRSPRFDKLRAGRIPRVSPR
jgi:hypothetical protein